MHPSSTANATTPTIAPAAAGAVTAAAVPQPDRAVRLLAAIRVALVAALTVLVLAIAALAYVVSFEAIRAFAVETAAFPAELAWSAPLLVDSFTSAASLVILWRYLRGDAWRDPWYAWSLVAGATAVSVALNVAHAPDRLAAQLFAALPPVALLGALELLMSVARCGLPHTTRSPATAIADAPAPTAPPSATAPQPPPRPLPPAPQDRSRPSQVAPRPAGMAAGRSATAAPASASWSPASAPAAPGWPPARSPPRWGSVSGAPTSCCATCAARPRSRNGFPVCVGPWSPSAGASCSPLR
jgi:Protein of unknown function (DUF2637)